MVTTRTRSLQGKLRWSLFCGGGKSWDRCCGKKSFGQAIFEGDSEIVVKALVGDCPIWSSIGHIVKDYKPLTGLFQICTFSHVRRQSNGVAHALTQRVRNSFPLSVWTESVPPNISYLIYVGVTQ